MNFGWFKNEGTFYKNLSGIYNTIHNSLWLIFLIGALIGAVMFVSLYGYRILNVTYTDWIYAQTGQDLIQHQLGFEFFRYDDWRLPLGSNQSYGYPIGTSVVYTDSVPVFAILFKALSGILPADFQYFGLWGIMCFMLQGGLSCVILRKYIPTLSIIFTACPFFVYSTVVILRMYAHTALAGQWIILLAFYVCVYREKFKSLTSRILWWSALTALSVSIHAYFIIMVGVIMVGFLISDCIENKKFLRVIAIFISAILSTIGVFWLIGGFESSGKITESGLGEYSMNLNSLFNTFRYGRFLAELPSYSPAQVEGFQYLGFGFLLLFPIAGFLLLSNLTDKEQRKKLDKKFILRCIPIVFVCLALTVLALSPRVTLNEKVVFDYTDFKFIVDILSIFRATGRLFWPVYYIIIFAVVIFISKGANHKKFVSIIFAFCVVIQIYDLVPLMAIRTPITQPGVDVQYESELESEFWDVADYKHLEFLSDDIDGYEPLAIYAAQNKMTMNNGNIARKNFELTSKNIKDTIDNIKKGNIAEDTMYIVPTNRIFINEPLRKDNIVEFHIDGYYIFVAKDSIDERKFYSDIVR